MTANNRWLNKPPGRFSYILRAIIRRHLKVMDEIGLRLNQIRKGFSGTLTNRNQIGTWELCLVF